MKQKILSFFWALFCAWLTTLVLAWLNTKIEFTGWLFIPSLIDFLHAHEWAPKDILFYALTLFYWATGIHKAYGIVLYMLIGIATFAVVSVLVLGFGILLINWLTGLL